MSNKRELKEYASQAQHDTPAQLINATKLKLASTIRNSSHNPESNREYADLHRNLLPEDLTDLEIRESIFEICASTDGPRRETGSIETIKQLKI